MLVTATKTAEELSQRVNEEWSSSLLTGTVEAGMLRSQRGRRPRQCAESIGELLRYGTDDRLLYASGIPNGHPHPVFDSFSRMEMPEDLVEQQDMPLLSEELKKKILGTNMLALHGIDPEEKKRKIAGDEWDKQRQAARAEGGAITPWRAHREAIGTLAAA